MSAMRFTWDIFCSVIDNFGDVGVAWRLARGLAGDHGQAVRLWVDDLATFRRIWPAIDERAAVQACEGVTVCMWRTPFGPSQPGQVVVEAFGCALPEPYLARMAAQTPPPVWINLEYLSAEPWVAGHHGLPSPHPRLPLTKHFFFPGYHADTGGVLVEADLAVRRAAFLAAGRPGYWAGLGLAAPAAGELRVSLFAYENAALARLLDAWAADDRPVACLVPEGRVLPQVARWLGRSALHTGEAHRRGALTLHALPFADQDAYDRLLWACDLNFVRGEDSCVRAQWAGRPLVWQAYPQADAAHWQKMEALLALYTAGLPDAAAHAIADLWRSWNGIPVEAGIAACWAAWRAHQETIAQHAESWPRRLAGAGSLAAKLVDFAEKQLE